MTDKIDWNDNAKAAVKEFASYIGNSNSVYRFIRGKEKLSTEPERKTVHDALEVFTKWPFDTDRPMCYSPNTGAWFNGGTVISGECQVCTREEFEKARGEKMRQKVEWSRHANVPVSFTDVNGDIYELNDCCGDRAEYYKAKPTITKAQAWDKVFHGTSITAILSKYDIAY